MWSVCLILGLVTSPVSDGTSTKSDLKIDHVALAHRVKEAIVEKMPKQYQDSKEWGGTVPPDESMKLQRLRTRVLVNGREEWPHGTWKRTRLWMDDPARDMRLEVRDLKRLDNGKVRLQLAATVAGHVEQERLRWRNGIQLLNLSVYADGVVTAHFDCEVGVTLNVTSFPPTLTVEPKVVGCRLELGEYALRQIGPVSGEGVRELGNELRGIVSDLIHTYEPKAQELANRAIAKALKDGKATFPATAFLPDVTKSKSVSPKN